MASIKFTVLDNTNLRLSIDNQSDFIDVLSRNYVDERHFLADMMEDSGYIGNDWDCLYNIGMTECPAIGQGAIYPDNEEEDNDGYPIDYENLWFFGDYMILDYLAIIKENGFVDFKRH